MWFAAPMFSGVGVALVTIFDEHLALDAAATADVAAGVCASGVGAVLVAGTTGEASTLSTGERAELVSAVRERVPAGVVVLAGTGAASGRLARAHASAVTDAGADGIVVLSPPGVPDPTAYYETATAGVPAERVLAYHFPAASAPGVPLELLGRLPVSGVKDSSGDPRRLLEHVDTYGEDCDVFVGAAALTLMAGAVGARGVILKAANTQPEHCLAAFRGDADAQVALSRADSGDRGLVPSATKAEVARRYGVSAACRLGA